MKRTSKKTRRGNDGPRNQVFTLDVMLLEDQPENMDLLIEQITAGAANDAEKFRAFLRAFEKHVEVPFDAFVIGEPISVVAFGFDGNERRGVTTTCKREDGSEHAIALAEVTASPRTKGGDYLVAYRRWLGLDSSATSITRTHKAKACDIDMSRPVELIALSASQSAVRCLLPESRRVVTLRADRIWSVAPGEILVIKPRKQWSYSGHPYLSGEIESARLDATALDLVPLRLTDWGLWNPEEAYWGEEDDPIEEWCAPIIRRGERRAFEMEQVLPGADPGDYDDDPITRAADFRKAGDRAGAEKLLMRTCEADLRCLDAHSHLGNLDFDHRLEDAIRHYEAGLRIGELSFADESWPGHHDALLPWGCVDNRPFLRCMHGYGLCLWRLGRFKEATEVFDRMLWLNPMNNQGIRFLIDDVRDETPWEKRRSE